MMIRRVDELGRIVLPIGIRRALDIQERDEVDVFVDGETIVLRKIEKGCTFCGQREDLTPFKGKYICNTCKAQL